MVLGSFIYELDWGRVCFNHCGSIAWEYATPKGADNPACRHSRIIEELAIR